MRGNNIPTLQEIRQNYPVYNHVDDETLSNALYKKYGAGQDRGVFYDKIGYKKPSFLQSTKEFAEGSVHNLADLLRSGLLGFGSTGSNLVDLLTHSNIAPTEQEQAKALGWKMPSDTTQRVAEAAGSLPFYALGTETGAPLLRALKASPRLASLLSFTGTSGLIGSAEEPNNRLMGALKGLGAGAIGAAIPEAGKIVLGGVLNKMHPVLQKTLSELLEERNEDINPMAFKRIAKNYENAKNAESKAWDNLLTEAKKQQKDGFDETKYKSWLEKLHDKIITDAHGQTHLEEQVSPTIEELRKLHSSPVENMEDAIAHRKAINSIIAGQAKEGPTALSDSANKFLGKVINGGLKNFKGIKSKFDESILENLGNMKNSNRLAEAWKNANDATKMLKKFETSRSLSGKPVPSKFYTMYRYGASPDEASRFVEQYSNTKGGGVSQFKKLEEMLGSQEESANVLKNNIFSPSYEGEDISLKNFKTRYDKLSTAQKDYLFDKGKQQHIRDILKLAEKYPEKKVNLHRLGYFAAMHTPSGLLGLYLGEKASHSLGVPGWVGGIAGAALGTSSVRNLDKLVADISKQNPEIRDFLLKSAIKNLKTKPELSAYQASKRAAIPSSLLDYLGENNGSE